MPGTHLLPPNLLKLFAPRPPLPYVRPVGRDPDRIHKKDVSGVAQLLAQIKEEGTQSLIESGNQALLDGMEEGEEPVYTHAEETRRQIKREERRKAKEDKFKTAKETCTLRYQHVGTCTHLSFVMQTNQPMTLRQ